MKFLFRIIKKWIVGRRELPKEVLEKREKTRQALMDQTVLSIRWNLDTATAGDILDMAVQQGLSDQEISEYKQRLYESLWEIHIDLFGKTYAQSQESVFGKPSYDIKLMRFPYETLIPTQEWLEENQ